MLRFFSHLKPQFQRGNYPPIKEKIFMPNTVTTIYYPRLFDYQEDGSIFANPKYKRGKALRYGAALGTPTSKGHLQAEVYGKRLYVHRIIYEMHNGPIPKGLQIDHVDGNPSNNRIENLRLATNAQNSMNKRPHVNRKCSLPKNVQRNGKGYRAEVRAGGVRHCSKVFKTVEEAEQVAIALRNKLHGEFARHH